MDRLERVVAALDETIADIRATIFSIRSPAPGVAGLRGEIAELVASAAAHLGFAPALGQTGPIDGVPADVAGQALAVVREALSNTVRHAHATSVDIAVSVEMGELRISVADNGIGLAGNDLGDDAHRGGLRNMAERARALGGGLDLSPGMDGRGATVLWQVPLPG
ncbi:sensor histidine kinase [Nocardia sp. NPDC003693]